MLTAVLASKLLRQILVDYNYWPESESDSPLKVFRSKSAFTDVVALARDASMRRAAVKLATPEVTGYKAPERRLEAKTLNEVFLPQIAMALNNVKVAAELVQAGTNTVSSLELPLESAEYFVQLHGVFSQLNNTKVTYVRDGDNISSDPYTGFFISGETADGETLIASTLLIQT